MQRRIAVLIGQHHDRFDVAGAEQRERHRRIAAQQRCIQWRQAAFIDLCCAKQFAAHVSLLLVRLSTKYNNGFFISYVCVYLAPRNRAVLRHLKAARVVARSDVAVQSSGGGRVDDRRRVAAAHAHTREIDIKRR